MSLTIFQAMQYLGHIRSERPKAETETLEDASTPETVSTLVEVYGTMNVLRVS